MPKPRAFDPETYKLSDFSPRYFNIHRQEVSKAEFEREREALQKPYFDHLEQLHKKKKGDTP